MYHPAASQRIFRPFFGPPSFDFDFDFDFFLLHFCMTVSKGEWIQHPFFFFRPKR